MSGLVLIMEDEMDMRFYLTALVSSMGLTPEVTRNGAAGLTALAEKKEQVELIILDVMMPEKGGAWVYRELKTHADFRHIPLVIFSGVEATSFHHYVKMINAETGLDLPMPDYYVEKTADPEYLKKIIHQSLERIS